MPIKINYKNNSVNKNISNLILFTDEKFNISNFKKKVLSDKEYYFIIDLLKSKNLKKSILFFDVNSKKKIVLVSIKKKYPKFRFRKFRC